MKHRGAHTLQHSWLSPHVGLMKHRGGHTLQHSWLSHTHGADEATRWAHSTTLLTEPTRGADEATRWLHSTTLLTEPHMGLMKQRGGYTLQHSWLSHTHGADEAPRWLHSTTLLTEPTHMGLMKRVTYIPWPSSRRPSMPGRPVSFVAYGGNCKPSNNTQSTAAEQTR